MREGLDAPWGTNSKLPWKQESRYGICLSGKSGLANDPPPRFTAADGPNTDRGSGSGDLPRGDPVSPAIHLHDARIRTGTQLGPLGERVPRGTSDPWRQRRGSLPIEEDGAEGRCDGSKGLPSMHVRQLPQKVRSEATRARATPREKERMAAMIASAERTLAGGGGPRTSAC